MEPTPVSPRPAFVRRATVRNGEQASGNSQPRTSTLQFLSLDPLRSERASIAAPAPRSSRSCPPGQQSLHTPRGRNSVQAQDSGNLSPRLSQDDSQSLRHEAETNAEAEPAGGTVGGTVNRALLRLRTKSFRPQAEISEETQQPSADAEAESVPKRALSERRHTHTRKSVKSVGAVAQAIVRMRRLHKARAEQNADESPAFSPVLAKPKVVYNMEDAVQQPKLPVLSFNHPHGTHFLGIPAGVRDLQAQYNRERHARGIDYQCPLCGEAHTFRLGQEGDCV